MSLLRRTIAAAIAVACSAPLALAPASWAGDGGFAAGTDLPTREPSSIAAGDFNNDGRADLAVASDGNRRLEVYLQAATGGLAPAVPVSVGPRPQLIAVADFDNDGNDDLAVGDAAENDVKIRLGDGNGPASFQAGPDIDLGKTPLSLVTGDFNADGREDIAAATRDPKGPPHQIAVRLGGGDGRFPRGSDVGRGAAALAVADFNSDANEDLAYGGFTTEPPGSVLLGQGNLNFSNPFDIPLPQSAASRHGWATGDFNKDQKPDVVAALAQDLTAVRLGAGDGKFSGGSEILTPGTPSAVAVGDLNSDGNDDFVATDTAGSKSVRVRLGNGAGGFSNAPDVPVGTNPVDVAIADFDTDGNEDLAVVNSEGSISIRPGTGRSPLDGNLLVNGGFEGRTYTGHVRPPFSIDGWQLVGGVGVAKYGGVSHAFAPSRIASPRYGGGGRMLTGGYSTPTNGVTGVTQVVDVSANAEGIDAGRTTANLSAHLGGALKFEDSFTATAEFLGGGNSLGSFEIGPVTAADRNNQTTLLPRAGNRPVPAGTRQIRVRLTSNDVDKTYSSALADNAKLTLTTAPVQAGGGGNDGGGGGGETPATQRFGAKTLVTISPASRRVKAKQPVRVKVRNANGFAVTGRLGTRRLNVGAQSSTTVKVKLTAKQRRALQRKRSVAVRLTAVVTDPAGESRRVSRRVRLLRSK
jgi:hypothetical protein